MPKKTRKEKMLAVARRHHGKMPPISQSAIISPSSLIPSPSVPAYVFQSPHGVHAVAADVEELVFIKRDLLRTVLLSLVAIGVEVALYMRLGR